MNRIIILAALAALALPAFGQVATCNAATPAICTPGYPSGDVQIKPQAVATSTLVVTGYDAYLKLIVVSNTTGGALTITVADRQASPVNVLTTVSIAANSTTIFEFLPGTYWCPGGFTVLASGSGLTYYAAWRQ